MGGRGVALANAAGAVGCLFTGASIVATRFAVGQIDPVSLAFLRYLIAALCLAPIVVVLCRQYRLPARDLLVMLVLGALFFGAFPWFFNLSLAYTSATRGALVLATSPMMTLALASLVRSEAFTGLKLLAVVAAFAGVAVAIIAGPGGIAGGGRAWIGDLLMLAAAAIAATYPVFAKPLLMRHPPVLVTLVSMAGGVAALAPFAAAHGLFAGLPAFDAGGWLAIVFLGVGGGAIQFGLWIWAVSRLTPTQASIFLCLTPITALLLAGLILGEALTLALFAGLLMVIAGILLSNWRTPAPKVP
ncbi:MAG TPA: DMT family transporter [Alphaproteobacteria bacterium]|nr:DMT family transporter [Alphaproteobacteria bacterium]